MKRQKATATLKPGAILEATGKLDNGWKLYRVNARISLTPARSLTAYELAQMADVCRAIVTAYDSNKNFL